MYLLDTNICIFLKNRKPIQVLERLHSIINTNVFISSISVAELQFGVYNSQNIEKNHVSLVEFLAPFKIINFDDNDAEEFGKIRTELKRTGKLMDPYDILIAAQALAKNLILVTNNTNEFKRIGGLKLEDWR